MSKKNIYEKALQAIYKKDINQLKECLLELKDVNIVDSQKKTLIFYAVLENNIEALKFLIKEGGSVNLKDENGWTPLHYSVSEHLIEVSQYLIDVGADINAKDDYGNTVIWRAVFTSKERGEIIKMLIKNKADSNIKNDSGISALELANTIANYNVEQFFKN